jgi:hypothetical protein
MGGSDSLTSHRYHVHHTPELWLIAAWRTSGGGVRGGMKALSGPLAMESADNRRSDGDRLRDELLVGPPVAGMRARGCRSVTSDPHTSSVRHKYDISTARRASRSRSLERPPLWGIHHSGAHPWVGCRRDRGRWSWLRAAKAGPQRPAATIRAIVRTIMMIIVARMMIMMMMVMMMVLLLLMLM